MEIHLQESTGNYRKTALKKKLEVLLFILFSTLNLFKISFDKNKDKLG